MEPRDALTILGRTNFRGERKLFGIRQADRRSHLYVIGKTGTGKSTLLLNLMRQDLAAGRGFALFDPYGDLVEHVLSAVRADRKDDVVYVDIANRTAPLGFKPLAGIAREKRA